MLAELHVRRPILYIHIIICLKCNSSFTRKDAVVWSMSFKPLLLTTVSRSYSRIDLSRFQRFSKQIGKFGTVGKVRNASSLESGHSWVKPGFLVLRKFCHSLVNTLMRDPINLWHLTLAKAPWSRFKLLNRPRPPSVGFQKCQLRIEFSMWLFPAAFSIGGQFRRKPKNRCLWGGGGPSLSKHFSHIEFKVKANMIK